VSVVPTILIDRWRTASFNLFRLTTIKDFSYGRSIEYSQSDQQSRKGVDHFTICLRSVIETQLAPLLPLSAK